MVPLARRNLFHDKMKLTTALVGVVFSVVLVTSLGGLYIASSDNATGIIRNAGGDLWIAAKGTRSIDLAEPISRRRLYQTLATPGVLWAEPLLMHFSQWRLSDGRQEVAEVVGLLPRSKLNLPWGMSAGKSQCIRHDDGVIIDERERKRFGSHNRLLEIGDRVEILNTRTRVAGFSQGVGSFTNIPYVFMTERQARQCTQLGDEQTKFVVVKAAPEANVEQLRHRLAAHMPDVDILTTDQFTRLTRDYWLFGTGVGMGIIFAAALGLIVGAVIVSQTIYASTLDRLPEFGTLKALGMGNMRLALVIIQQALLIGLMGNLLGTAAVSWLSGRMMEWHLPIEIPPWLYAAMIALTVVMCAAASVTSVLKVFRLPPATVFRS
ncbi:MAG TPA: ABC transporter permease [Phycisphaerae bacterium]|nr:ABC transporter permease [Phycisphaerae bacterium]